ncbi:hypothetical protein TSARBOMBA_109 [Bacillus phage TsarBomba]|uniref:Uncharacterized protein n=1 Tax=Bacillus phage TsarBomba TaxID=1690456 RepID=A0A0K2CZZ2_9CAUD|nr:hypothetical protein TSARBOMBA_109 [Bacillus phage TsarBomba]ALA12997.1 hypothetical protein TSARBOMBA_109 [Bacillus phage TsarBomba]
MGMSISGGINMYNFLGKERHESDTPPHGRLVKYTNTGGTDHDRKQANLHFKEGQILTVQEIYVSAWSSEVEFVGYPFLKFNTVMFEDIEF